MVIYQGRNWDIKIRISSNSLDQPAGDLGFMSHDCIVNHIHDRINVLIYQSNGACPGRGQQVEANQQREHCIFSSSGLASWIHRYCTWYKYPRDIVRNGSCRESAGIKQIEEVDCKDSRIK